MKLTKAFTIFFAAVLLAGFLQTAQARGNGKHAEGPVIYVAGQNLFYDSIVLTMLPQKGPFQQLHITEDGLWTEFGPGDHEFVGGRWWVDANPNGEMDDGDLYFSCPLLGPGRLEP